MLGGTYRSVSVPLCVAFACATMLASALVESPARAAERAETRVAVPDSANCAACHFMDDGFSHPVGVVASMPVPAVLPLENGRITCETCHDGELGRGHSVSVGSGKAFLRMPEELGSLCGACHTSSAGRAAHGSGSLRAHLAESDAQRARPGIDAESQACIGCHDGVTASDAGAHPVLSRAGEDEDAALGSDHPIGVVLDGAKRRFEGGRFKEPRSVDHRVRLFNRTVGCGSCHSVYAKREALLVMSNQGSALCVSCHAL